MNLKFFRLWIDGCSVSINLVTEVCFHAHEVSSIEFEQPRKCVSHVESFKSACSQICECAHQNVSRRILEHAGVYILRGWEDIARARSRWQNK
jgi:hypothetical protein